MTPHSRLHEAADSAAAITEAEMSPRADIKSLYYITHVENIPSILQHGILSHSEVAASRIPFTPIYDEQIVSNRKAKHAPGGASLWDYANVYFQPRNPMMYRVVHEKGSRHVAIVGVRPEVLSQGNVIVTDGNAASSTTRFYSSSEGLEVIRRQWSIIQSDWWNDVDGSKRRIMAECLVLGRIGPDWIDSIYVADHETRARVKALARTVHVIPEPNLFFRPSSRARVGENISLVEGDMFFSSMQTLTVSVNLQGIMGKGLASRAKYQFPDVYVFYQDACRSRRLTATRPCLYKREASLDAELADLDVPMDTPNGVKWFLLFATKRKWRENSRIDDIEQGLQWFRNNYRSEGVTSIAMPALGCGLGGLEWKEVGPIMCRSLHGIGIEVAIYLPRERPIEPRFLKASHLLGS